MFKSLVSLALCVAVDALSIGFEEPANFPLTNVGVRANIDINEVEGNFFFGLSFETTDRIVAGVRHGDDGSKKAVVGVYDDCLGDKIESSCQVWDIPADGKLTVTVDEPGGYEYNTVGINIGDSQQQVFRVPHFRISKPAYHQTNLDTTCTKKGKADSKFFVTYVVDGGDVTPPGNLSPTDYHNDIECGTTNSRAYLVEANSGGFVADYSDETKPTTTIEYSPMPTSAGDGSRDPNLPSTTPGVPTGVPGTEDLSDSVKSLSESSATTSEVPVETGEVPTVTSEAPTSTPTTTSISPETTEHPDVLKPTKLVTEINGNPTTLLTMTRLAYDGSPVYTLLQHIQDNYSLYNW